jgi:polynucleotide 5'-triphosphatase
VKLILSPLQATHEPEITHELEVEVARPALLLTTAANRNNQNIPEHESGAFDELIRAFVNNARTLIRNVSMD